MKKTLKILTVSVIIIATILTALSCSKTPENTISQAEYDAVKAQLSEAQAKIIELQATTTTTSAVSLNEQVLKDEIADLQAQIDKLGNDILDLDAQNESLAAEKASLEAQYAELNTKYTNLLKSPPTTIEPKEEITTEKIENAIFTLINAERTKAGIPELLFGKNLQSLARSNGQNMARLGRFEYDVSVAYQEVFWGINYTSVDSIATAAMKTWTLNQYRFKTTALLVTNKYGGVGAYYEDGVYFITFMAAGYP